MAPQWLQSSPQAGSPPVAPLGLQFQNPSDAQAQQVIQQQVKKLDWTFPALPKIPTPQTLVHVDRQSNPVYTHGVTVSCNETAVHVEVRKDVLGHDLTNIAFLTLGGCPAQGMDAASPVLIYESLLNGCKSMLTMTADELVWCITLGMSPVPISGTPILRRASTRVMIQCHYPRWTAAYGPNQVCSCCNSSCAGRKGRDLSARARRTLPSKKGLQLAKRVRLGPITVLENVW
ncbi:zona pellucida sperm-binding protein 3 [Silurus meridionalis]|nr:zona pellucida sperm-binding protein 3 [Silurus meridionalis]